MNQQILQRYIQRVTPLVHQILETHNAEFVFKTTLLGDYSRVAQDRAKHAFKEKQIKMLEGEIGQIMIGCWEGWMDLGIGHTSGLDNRRADNSCIMELKNQWNTCNSGSKKAVLDKLAKYKEENPETTCVFGMINPKPGQKQLRKVERYNGQEIVTLWGDALLDYVFTHDGYNYKNEVIEIIKGIMY
jgi:hypothetical protein